MIRKCLSAFVLGLLGNVAVQAVELPESYNVGHAQVDLNYDASENVIKLKYTPSDYITYTEGGEQQQMSIDFVDKIVIYRGGKDANGDYHNSTYIIKEIENVPAGRVGIFNDTDILPGERYVYYVRTYVGEEHDWPDMNEIYTYVKPAMVGSFAASAADEKGSLPVTLSGVAPSKTETGANLSESDLTAIVFVRAPYEFNHGGQFEEVGRIENPAPGSKFSWQDTSAELNQAYSYGAYAESGVNKGETSLLMFRTGQDLPVSPTNLAVVNNMTSLELTWDAVVAGQDGGYVNADEMTYNLYEFKTNTYPEPEGEELLVSGISGTKYVIDFSEIDHPVNKLLRLRACTPSGESDYVAFESQIVGNPAVLPWKEGFNKTVNEWGGVSSEHCWTISALMNIGDPGLYYTTYGIYYTDPYNNVGRVQYTGIDGDLSDADAELREGLVSAFYDRAAVDVMLSEPISFAGIKNPKLSFYAYQIPAVIESENYIEVFVSAASGDFVSLGTIPCYSSSADEGWKQFEFDMPQLADAEYGHVKFHAVAGGVPAPISIDGIEIYDDPNGSYLMDAAAGQAVDVIYFNMSGVRVKDAAKGVYVKTTVNADGTFKSEKVIR